MLNEINHRFTGILARINLAISAGVIVKTYRFDFWTPLLLDELCATSMQTWLEFEVN